MSKKESDFGIHNLNDSHRNQQSSMEFEGSIPFRPKAQDISLVEDHGIDSSIYYQGKEDHSTPPPVSQSLAVLADHLGISTLSLEHCLYVGNISVRADKQEIAEWLSHLGPLQLFEFTVKDKQFRFQGGIAIYSTANVASYEMPARPFVIAKRKVKLMQLSARKNASTLLAVLLKRRGLSLPQAHVNLTTMKNRYDIKTIPDQKQSVEQFYSPSQSSKSHSGPTGSAVDTYYSAMEGLKGPTVQSTRIQRMISENSGALSSSFVADRLQRFIESIKPISTDVPSKRATTASFEECKLLTSDKCPGTALTSGSLALSRCSIPLALINSVGQNHQTKNLRFNILVSSEPDASESRLSNRLSSQS